MTNLSEVVTSPNPDQPGALPGSITQVGQGVTLFAGKILNSDDTNLWTTVGTGTGSFTNNQFDMDVAAGEYLISQGNYYTPYFEGNPHRTELTCINFQNEANVVKRIGRFSSSSTPPYTANLDGYWLEADGTTHRVIAYRDGTETVNAALDISEWDNSDQWSTFDFEDFAVFYLDFLWLGGAALNVYGVKDDAFLKAFGSPGIVGQVGDYITRGPNHPVRYEIRSTTGTGTLTRCCAKDQTLGSISESGREISTFNASAIATNTAGNIYVIKGVRKRTDRRDAAIKVVSVAGNNTTAGFGSDTGMIQVYLDPTITGGSLTYNNLSNFQQADGASTLLVTAGTGRLLLSFPASRAGGANDFKEGFLSWLPIDIDDTPGEIILAYQPTSATQSFHGHINLKEF